MQKELREALTKIETKLEENNESMTQKLKDVTKVADGFAQKVSSFPHIEMDANEVALSIEPVLERIGTSLSQEVAVAFRQEVERMRDALTPAVADLRYVGIYMRAAADNKKVIINADGDRELAEKTILDHTLDYAKPVLLTAGGTVLGILTYEGARAAWDKAFGEKDVEVEIAAE